MVKMKGLQTLLLIIMQFQAILSSDEVSQNSILMERLDSIEAVQELHNLKIEQVETLFTGLKGKLERLEIKDKEILGDLGKLDQKIAGVSSSVLSLSSSKITTEQRLQTNNGPIQLELSGDEIIESVVSDIYGKIMNKMNPTTVTPLTTKLTTALKTGPDFKVIRTLPLKHAERKSYPLMNKHGKCLAVQTTGKIHPSENGAKIVQSTCNPTEKGQLWKYDNRKGLLCNDWNKCLSIPFSHDSRKTIPTLSFNGTLWPKKNIKSGEQ